MRLYDARMKLGQILFFLLITATAAFSCELRYDPAAAPDYYREKGWKLPGINDGVPFISDQPHEFGMSGNVPGAKASIIEHVYPFVIMLPAQDFLLNGTRQRMRRMQVKATILRWVIAGLTVAYSYGLIPVTTHKEHGKWKITTEMGCIFTATLVDDRGDGVFRLLVPNAFTPDLVPFWIRKES